MKRITSIGSVVCLLSGCAAAPDNHYYTLSIQDPAQAPSTIHTTLFIADVHLPGTVRRPQIVERTGAQTVAIREFDRWAEPLDEMTSRVLNNDLAIRSGAGGIPQRVCVNIDAFMADISGKVQLTGSRSDLSGKAGDTTRKFSFSTQTDPVQIADVAAAMSELLGELADQIVRSR